MFSTKIFTRESVAVKKNLSVIFVAIGLLLSSRADAVKIMTSIDSTDVVAVDTIHIRNHAIYVVPVTVLAVEHDSVLVLSQRRVDGNDVQFGVVLNNGLYFHTRSGRSYRMGIEKDRGRFIQIGYERVVDVVVDYPFPMWTDDGIYVFGKNDQFDRITVIVPNKFVDSHQIVYEQNIRYRKGLAANVILCCGYETPVSWASEEAMKLWWYAIATTKPTFGQ